MADDIKNMPDYLESIPIDIQPRLIHVEQIKKEISDLEKALGVLEAHGKKEDKAYIDSLKKQIEERKKEINLIGDNGKKKEKELVDFSGIFEDFRKNLVVSFDNIISSFGKNIKKTFKDAWGELEDILDYSRISNAQTRENMLKYGFSSSQGYGFSRAMQMMGYAGEEDLYYGFASGEGDRFRELMTKYTDYYTRLYDEGFFDTLLDFEIEMEEFKQDMSLEVASFYMENKDLIKSALDWSIRGMEFLVKSVGSIISIMTGTGTLGSSTSDIINNYAGRTTTVKIDNTYNGIGTSDATNIANISQMTYQQIIKAIT